MAAKFNSVCRDYRLGTCKRGEQCKFLHPVSNPNPFGAVASRSSISFDSAAVLKSEDGVTWETEEQTKEQEDRSKRQKLVTKSAGKTLFEQLQERKDAAQVVFDAQKRMHFAPSQKLDEDEVAFLNEKADERRLRDKKIRDQELEDRMLFRESQRLVVSAIDDPSISETPKNDTVTIAAKPPKRKQPKPIVQLCVKRKRVLGDKKKKKRKKKKHKKKKDAEAVAQALVPSTVAPSSSLLSGYASSSDSG